MNLRLYCLQLCNRRVVICTFAQQFIVCLLLVRFCVADHLKTVAEFLCSWSVLFVIRIFVAFSYTYSSSCLLSGCFGSRQPSDTPFSGNQLMQRSPKQLLSVTVYHQSSLVKILYHVQGYNGVQLAATQVYIAMSDMAIQQTLRSRQATQTQQNIWTQGMRQKAVLWKP